MSACLLFGYTHSFGQIITTIAGTGVSGFSGDGGQALNAQFNAPFSICIDATDNIYVADYNNHRVRKIDAATGILTTIAGNGTPGFSGDGGVALNAQLNNPTWLCADNTGHLYIIDYGNLRIRMLDLVTGIITTVAGNGTQNYINGGLAVNSGMLPSSITMDKAGNLIISQRPGPLYTLTTNIISKLDMITGTITTIAGTGVPGFSGDGGPAINASFYYPEGLTFDAAGNLYVVDGSNFRIRKIDAVTGIISTIAGNGGSNFFVPDGSPALSISFKNPQDVFADNNGNLIMTDENDERVRKINLSTGLITTLAGDGYVGNGPDCVAATSISLNDCVTAVTDAVGSLYFNELAGNRIRKVFTPALNKPVINIAASKDPSCAGDLLTFTPTVTNSSGPLSYQWQINGQNVGGNTPIFTSASLNNGDIVVCGVTSTGNYTCAASTTVMSNSATVHISAIISPTVSISTASTSVCSGAAVSFTATSSGGGGNPLYQWMINSNKVGSNTNVFTTAGLADNDVVQCLLYIDPIEKCVAQASVISSSIIMKVSTVVGPSITISASANPICPGDSVVFIATVQNAGNAPSYQWLLNGVKSGGNNSSYGNAHLSDGDVVSCALTANNAACITNQPVLSNTELISVRQVPVIILATADTTILPGRQIILGASVRGNVQSWQWIPANELTDPYSLTPLTIPMVSTTLFQLDLVSPEGCSVHKNVLVSVFYKLAMPDSFTPNGDGKNDLFRIPPNVSMQLKEFSVFDRWGNRIFSTKDIGKGWDGTYKGLACTPGTYVFMVSGSNANGDIFSRGTVILLR
ncbi:MAG TPA: gliding motility-associated C-terminal domain-containing protein [Puia sp.]